MSLVLWIESLIKQYEARKKRYGGQIPGSSRQNDDSLKTLEKIAQEQHVSPKTVERAAEHPKVSDPPVRKRRPYRKEEIIIRGEQLLWRGEWLSSIVRERPYPHEMHFGIQLKTGDLKYLFVISSRGLKLTQ